MSAPRCGKKYGKRICRRLAHHAGRHAIRLTIDELRSVMRR